EISEFVPIESIDPVYFDKTYYLAPDKGAAKPYALLTEALRQAGRCGVGRWAARGKGYLVILRPIGDVLAMQQLHYAAEALRASLERSESARSQVTRLGPRKAPKRVEEPAKVTRKAGKRNG